MKKNKKLVIIVSVLLLGIGISLAYFLGKTLFTGDGATTKGTVATLNGATFTIEGELQFNDESIYPGHKTVSIIVGTATGDNVLIPYNIIWNGSNGLNAELKYTVYKSNEQKEVSATCEKKTKVRNGKQYLNEDCSISDLSDLEKVNEGTIGKKTESTEVSIANEEFITATTPSTKVYYYVVIEYPNLGENQNEDIGGTFDGTLSAKLSEATADITITKIYQQQEDKEYQEVDKIPDTETYTLNTKSSTCTHNAKPTWSNGLIVENLNKTGTECELYFDKLTVSEETIVDLGMSPVQAEIGPITGPSCSGSTCYSGGKISMNQNGLYEAGEDDDGISYVFRGTVDNNWIKFGKDKSNQDIWWRILRINGNGSLRLIYAGVGSNAPSTTDSGTNALTSAYNTEYNDNTYVGYYTAETNEKLTESYDIAHNGNTKSTVASKIDEWFVETNLDSLAQLKHIDENVGFCNDRTTATSNHGTSSYTNLGYGNNYTWYAQFDRVSQSNTSSYNTTEQNPTLKCTNKTRDLYTWKDHTKVGNQKLEYPVGLITIDEVIYAGGFASQSNSGYWLYTGSSYWTMTPDSFGGSTNDRNARVIAVSENSNLGLSYVYANRGVRPVINIKPDNVTLQDPSGNNKGTTSNPYIVSG